MGSGRFKFYFSGGMKQSKVWAAGATTTKFLALLLIPQDMDDYYHEEFLNGAIKYNLAVRHEHGIVDAARVQTLEGRGIPTRALEEYHTDLPYVKIFSSTMKPGRGSQYLSFYIQLGSHRPRKTVTIRPFNCTPDSYLFHAEGRILTKKKALALLNPKQSGYQILRKQSYKQFSRKTLRKMVQVHTEEEVVLSTARRIIRAPKR